MTSLTSVHDVDRPRAVAYVRVSTKSQDRKGDLLSQIVKILYWAQDNGVVIEWIFREVQNGALSSPTERPVLHECFQAAVRRNLKIVALDPSRISRSAENAAEFARILPDRFRFVNRAAGFEGVSWQVEVREKHSKLQANVSVGTEIAMDKQKRAGRRFGGPDGGVAGRTASSTVRGAKRLARSRAIADYLSGDPARLSLTCGELARMLNTVGISPAHGGSWTVASLRRPLKEAREMLAERSTLFHAMGPRDLSSGPEEVAGAVPHHDASLSARAVSSEPAQDTGSQPRTVNQPHVGSGQSGSRDKLAGLPVSAADNRDASLGENDQVTLEDGPLWGRF
jgi:hypothetical protein